MPPSVLVPLIDGFEEIEAITVIDILRRAGCRVTTAGVGNRSVAGSHDIRVEADTLLEIVAGDQFTAIVLPGGPGSAQLRDNMLLREMLKKHAAAGKLTAAICAAPTVLAAAGLLEGKRAACFPGTENLMGGANIVRESVVTDGPFLTSRGAGTAIPFALAVVAALLGKPAADSISKSIVYT
ncbi:DJ-1/PfpI family protein [soil metagenome]